MKVGVLALQGDFAAHAAVVSRLGYAVSEVRTQAQLGDVDALILPGGESTSLRIIARTTGMIEPLRAYAAAGSPIFGTCAGLIACAARLRDGDEPIVGHVDVTVERNAYGRQNESFEADLTVDGVGEVRAVFIRAPKITDIGEAVVVLATWDEQPVVIRQGSTWLLAFHPELTGEDRLHAAWLDSL